MNAHKIIIRRIDKYRNDIIVDDKLFAVALPSDNGSGYDICIDWKRVAYVSKASEIRPFINKLILAQQAA